MKRKIIIPAILALGAVGSVLAGTAEATTAPSAVVVTAHSAKPDTFFQG